MNFEEWEKEHSAEYCPHVVKKTETLITKTRCRLCVWQAAQGAMEVPQGKGNLGKNRIFQLGKMRGRKELAKEIDMRLKKGMFLFEAKEWFEKEAKQL